MSLRLLSNTQALGYGVPTPFIATGGVGPYSYGVVPGGAGGTIDPSTGLYTAPFASGVDQVVVTDSQNVRAYREVRVGTAIHLVCDILQRELGLAEGRVFLWDQKVFQPIDSGLFIAVSMLSCKPFGNNRRQTGDGESVIQAINMGATLQLDVISKSLEAVTRKEEAVMALNSLYAQQQQEINSFRIGTIPTGFTNLSMVDGAAIPYRFAISIGIQYFVRKKSEIPFYDEFSGPEIETNE